MARVLQLAKRGWYSTHPNPRVGCVIVNNGAVVGEGWHLRAGEAHAEVHALKAAADAAHGAQVFISLEPCCFQGRTPACTEALIAAGVAVVVVAQLDPNPRVAGRGLAALQQAGIKTRHGLLADVAEALNPGYNKRMRNGMPWLRLKTAISLDGRTALASGESTWISNAASRQDVQWLRAQSDCVLTGVNTLLADDPSLNVRLPAGQFVHSQSVRQPLRVILDTHLRTPMTAKCLQLPGSVLLFTATDTVMDDAWQRADMSIVQIEKTDAGRLDLVQVLQQLANRDINEIHVEAGSILCGAFLSAGLVDEIVCYLSPLLLGDAAHGFAQLPWIQKMSDRIDLELIDTCQIGQDLRLRYYLK